MKQKLRSEEKKFLLMIVWKKLESKFRNSQTKAEMREGRMPNINAMILKRNTIAN